MVKMTKKTREKREKKQNAKENYTRGKECGYIIHGIVIRLRAM